jgi:hypothetical protein
VSIAHVEHRLMNFHSAELGALDALRRVGVGRLGGDRGRAGHAPTR